MCQNRDPDMEFLVLNLIDTLFFFFYKFKNLTQVDYGEI